MANGLDFFFFLNIKIGALFCVTGYIYVTMFAIPSICSRIARVLFLKCLTSGLQITKR